MKKVLFTLIGGSTVGAKPIGMSLLSSILKQYGHEVILFDTTFMDLGHPLDGENSDTAKQFLPVDWKQYRLFRDSSIDAMAEFHKMIKQEQPDVIAVTCVSDMWYQTRRFLRETVQYNIPTIIGGIHATLLPEEVIKEEWVDALCIGEGEIAVPEFVNSIDNGRITRTNIKNLWIKKDGVVYRNPLNELINVNDLPFLDYSIYDERQFLRPYMGKIIRSGDTQETRGCPRICPYCINEFLGTLYPKNRIRFYEPERFVDEMEYLTKTWDLKFFKIFSEDMLLRKTDDLAKLSKLYKKRVNIPFTSHAHPLTVTLEKAKLLKDMNCVSISMALESGNETYRKDMLKRNYSNERFNSSTKILMDAGIRMAALNMMGMPYETKGMVFDTIDAIKKAKPTHANFYMFFPYRKTSMGELCIKEGYTTAEEVDNSRSSMTESILNMPQIKRNTLHRIRNAAYLLIKTPKILRPLIIFSVRKNVISQTIRKLIEKIVL